VVTWDGAGELIDVLICRNSWAGLCPKLNNFVLRGVFEISDGTEELEEGG